MTGSAMHIWKFWTKSKGPFHILRILGIKAWITKSWGTTTAKKVRLHHCCSQLPATRVCGGGGPAQLLWIVLSMTRVYGSGGGGPTMFSDKSIAKHAYKFNSIKSHNLSDKAYRKEKPQRLLGIYNCKKVSRNQNLRTD